MNLLQLPILRQDQWELASHPAKRKVACMGRRWGKSLMGGAVSVAVANAGGRVGWGAPAYKQTRPLWRWIENICAPLEKAGVQINRGEKVVTFPSGGFLGIYSLDEPDSVRSEAFHLFIVDESARVTNRERVDDAIEPALADFDGSRIDISTPKGKNEFYTAFNAALSDPTGYSHAWHAPSSANPHPNIRKAVMLAAQRVKEGRLTERSYRQEWLAEFVEGGTFFTNVRENATLKPSKWADHNHEVNYTVIGADWAQTQDYTVLVALCTKCNQVVEMDRFNGLSWAMQRERLKSMTLRWGNAEVLPERNSIGSPLIEQLQQEGIKILLGPDRQAGFYTSAQSKAVLVKTLYRGLANSQLQILDDPVLISELESFEENPTAYGATYSAPSGLHDDCVIALALAYYASQNQEQSLESSIDLQDYRGV